MNRRFRLVLVLTHALITQSVIFAIRPTLSYAVVEAGGSTAQLGLVAAAFAFPALIVALPVGHAIDRYGERIALITGPVGLLLGCVLTIMAGNSFLVLISAVMVLGLGHLLSVLGQQTLVVNVSTRPQLDAMFGLLSFVVSLGQSLGPLLLLVPNNDANVITPPVHFISLICGILSVSAIFVALFFRKSDDQPAAERQPLILSMLETVQIPKMPRALFTTAIVTASIDIFLIFVPAIGIEYGYSTAVVSGMLIARSVSSMASRLLLGFLIDILGRRHLLILSICLSALLLISMAFPLAPTWQVVVSAGWGFMIGTCHPVTMAWATGMARPGQRGLVVSLRISANRLGQSTLPVALSGLAAMSGASGVLIATGIALGFAVWSGSGISATTDREVGPELE